MQVGESVTSSDQALKVSLLSVDPEKCSARVKIEVLKHDTPRHFCVIVKHGEMGEAKIDYKTQNVHQGSEFSFPTQKGDAINGIEIVPVAPPEE